jgi:hypothetical protein
MSKRGGNVVNLQHNEAILLQFRPLLIQLRRTTNKKQCFSRRDAYRAAWFFAEQAQL